MSTNDAMRTLQRASNYIFSSRISEGPGKSMRGKSDLWYAMAILHECRNSIEIEADAAATSAAYRYGNTGQMLMCRLSA